MNYTIRLQWEKQLENGINDFKTIIKMNIVE
jgi:hypothetical protein